MALEIALSENKFGVPFSRAYSRIKGFRGNKTSTIYTVEVFATAEAATALRVEPVVAMSFTLPTEEAITGGIPGLYADLKKRTGFTGGKDV